MSAQLLAVGKQRSLLVFVAIGPVAFAALFAFLALFLDAGWTLAIWGWTAYMVTLIVFVSLAVLLHSAWRLLDPRRIVFLSSTRGASLDVRFTRSVMSFGNHGRLMRDSSAASLRAQLAQWAGTLPNQVDVKAQNSRVADLYAKQFPELEPANPDVFGRIQMSGRHTR